jgi:hypothetical protein
VLGLYSLGAISGGAAVLVAYLPPRGAVIAAIAAGSLVLLGVASLERAPYEAQVRKSVVPAPDGELLA